jgi:metal-sulfur cluster biosynthetic enzyme
MRQVSATDEVLPVTQEVAPADMPVDVALVWEPPWSRAMMSDAAREVLRLACALRSLTHPTVFFYFILEYKHVRYHNPCRRHRRRHRHR